MMYQTQYDDFNIEETSPSKDNVKSEYKKDILSIARRLLIYFVIFFFLPIYSSFLEYIIIQFY